MGLLLDTTPGLNGPVNLNLEFLSSACFCLLT